MPSRTTPRPARSRSPLRRLLLVLLGCLAVGGTVWAVEPGSPPDTPPQAAADDQGCDRSTEEVSTVSLPAMRGIFVCLVNTKRAKANAVGADGLLQRAADGHSRDMVARRFFAHDSPDGGTMMSRIRKTGYVSKARKFSVGETLAFGSGDDISSASLFTALMNSSVHAAIIRNATFDEVGVGLERGAPKGRGGVGLTVTMDFGVVVARK